MSLTDPHSSAWITVGISGARTKDGHPVLTFPDSRSQLTLEDFRLLVSYLLQVPPSVPGLVLRSDTSYLAITQMAQEYIQNLDFPWHTNDSSITIITTHYWVTLIVIIIVMGYQQWGNRKADWISVWRVLFQVGRGAKSICNCNRQEDG